MTGFTGWMGYSEISPIRRAVVIVTKCPEPGVVKTRLCPPLRPEQAADLAAAFLADTVALAQAVECAEVFLGYAPAHETLWFRAHYPGLPLLPQGEGDLGSRMARLFASAFSQNFAQVILIGTDTPHLAPERIAAAFSVLSIPDSIVLGPAEDGGYYLIGLSGPCPTLFEGIAWSTDTVLRETVARAEKIGRKTCLLPPERDIDTYEDLLWLVWEAARLPPSSATLSALRYLSLLPSSSETSMHTPFPSEFPC
ncbi:MAG TPA: TIGR04282 family arsenosugar biosynthesis glycosyltransferase [Chthonomonadales bacterium]|nr:TIGR04282 family arsenosugar biosynthesis glycosyltransferase [Chthonomonadales bacterium]